METEGKTGPAAARAAALRAEAHETVQAIIHLAILAVDAAELKAQEGPVGRVLETV